MFSKNKKKSKKTHVKKEIKDDLESIELFKKETPFDKIPNEVIAKAIKEILKKGI